jgi:hypothetical protein
MTLSSGTDEAAPLPRSILAPGTSATCIASQGYVSTVLLYPGDSSVQLGIPESMGNLDGPAYCHSNWSICLHQRS